MNAKDDQNEGIGRSFKTRAPPPEARRAEERGRTPRRTPPIFTRAALPAGHRPAWRASAPRASSTRSRASGEDSRPLRRPRPAASAAGPWPKRGRPSPERREAERGSSVAARQRRARTGGSRAKGGSVAAAQGGLEEGAAEGGKVGRAQGGKRRRGEAGPRHGGKRGQWGESKAAQRGERIMGFYFCSRVA